MRARHAKPAPRAAVRMPDLACPDQQYRCRRRHGAENRKNTLVLFHAAVSFGWSNGVHGHMLGVCSFVNMRHPSPFQDSAYMSSCCTGAGAATREVGAVADWQLYVCWLLRLPAASLGSSHHQARSAVKPIFQWCENYSFVQQAMHPHKASTRTDIKCASSEEWELGVCGTSHVIASQPCRQVILPTNACLLFSFNPISKRQFLWEAPSHYWELAEVHATTENGGNTCGLQCTQWQQRKCGM